MRLATLQFSPRLGKVEENIARANALLRGSTVEDFDVLVLPEMAFTGYNFPSRAAITPFLEPTASGVSFQWAEATAARLQCVVTVGYPELATDLICYNATVTVSATGFVLAHYRKTHLYHTDETWAQESPTGWHTATLPLLPPRPTITTFGICMDLNPYHFTAPWTLYEFANHALTAGSQLLLLSMAWLTDDLPPSVADEAEPDMKTLAYWCARLQPLINQKEEDVVVVIANRSGEEEGQARYAGTSWIGKVGKGKVEMWGVLGRGEERVLVADTEMETRWRLTIRQRD